MRKKNNHIQRKYEIANLTIRCMFALLNVDSPPTRVRMSTFGSTYRFTVAKSARLEYSRVDVIIFRAAAVCCRAYGRRHALSMLLQIAIE